MADASSKAQMDSNFEKRLRECQATAADEAAARLANNQTMWHRPAGWAGDPFDFSGMGTPFDRSSLTQDYLSAVKDPEAPGTTGDVVATTTMIEVLSGMERALRVRHTLRRPRAMAHLIARKRAQGEDSGVFVQAGLEYLRNVLKQAKET